MGLPNALFERLSPLGNLQLQFLGLSIPLFYALLAVFVASRAFKYLHELRAVGYLPGYCFPFQPMAVPSAFFPTSKLLNMGIDAHWRWRHTLYTRFGGDTISIVPYLAGIPTIYTSNLDVIRQVVSNTETKTAWKKSWKANRALSKWGPNLFTMIDNDRWRVHRRVLGRAFDNKLYALVWTETIDLYSQILSVEGWDSIDIVSVPYAQAITIKLALLVIARCGFGFPSDWSLPPQAPGGKMSIQQALRILADNYNVSLLAPSWVKYLPIPGFAKIREAYTQLTQSMQEEIASRTSMVQSQGNNSDEKTDAFTLLVRANEQETGKFRLSDEEVIGNVFVLWIGGHETTANTLASTISLLAIHPEVQNEVLDQILSVVGYDRDPTFKDYDNLYKVTATFNEGLRMYPAGHITIREAAEDTVLKLPNPIGHDGTKPLPVGKGTILISDMIGLHMNPRYYSDPGAFKPSRFYSESKESEMFAPFGTGPRQCIGKKFSTVEATAFLTMFIRDWYIEPLLLGGEPLDAWKQRVLENPVIGLTLGPGKASVKLSRRKRM